MTLMEDVEIQNLIANVETHIKEVGKVNELEQRNGHQAAPPALGESAQKILDQTKSDVLSVFQNAIDRLNDTRRVCDAAEQLIKDRRENVERALFSYIQTVEKLAKSNASMQQTIGDIAAVNDLV